MGSIPDSWKSEPGPVFAKRNMAREPVIRGRRQAKRAEIEWHARSTFFASARDVDPQVFWSLSPTREEFEIMGAAWAALPKEWNEERIAAIEAWHASRGQDYATFKQDWQDRYRLRDEWCWKVALATIMRGWPLCPPPPVEGVKTFGMMEVTHTLNETSKPYVPPIPDEDVLAIMRRAEAELDRSCHLWPCLRVHQRTREDGWANLGSIGEIESGQTHQVRWHRERQEGRLVRWELTPHGCACRPFPMQVSPSSSAG